MSEIMDYFKIETTQFECARFNVGSNMLVCVVSRHIYLFSHSFNLNVTSFTISLQHNIF